MSERPWGVGMPAWLHLHEFADLCQRAFGGEVYLVGSSLRTKRPRDIDVRLEMPDAEFQARFGAMERFGKPGSNWAAVCMAFSALGKQMTGKRIDFQIEPTAMALVHRDDPKLRLGKDGDR